MAEATTQIESKQLIGFVFLRKEVWDQTSPVYRNRVLVENSWKELAEEFNVPDDYLKKKWKGLRDTYGKILRNLPVSRSGDAGDEDNESSWPFFKCMQFLKNQIKPRKTSGNLKQRQPKPTEEDSDDIDGQYEDVEVLDESSSELHESIPGWFEVPDKSAGSSSSQIAGPPPGKKKKTSKHGQSERMFEIERKKLELLEKKTEIVCNRDEDESFFTVYCHM